MNKVTKKVWMLRIAVFLMFSAIVSAPMFIVLEELEMPNTLAFSSALVTFTFCVTYSHITDRKQR